MIEQELKDIWNNSTQSAEISIETSRLSAELDSRVTSIRKKIRNRDTREIAASVFGIVLFCTLLVEIPFPLTRIACVLAIIWFFVVIFKFRKSKLQNTPVDFSLPMSDQLAHQKVLMQQQADLLDSATYWYAIPPFIMNFLFIVGLGNPTDYQWTNGIAATLLPLTLQLKVVTLIGLALFYGFTVWVNKRAANKHVKPILENLRRMQEQLKNE